ncbi:MAG: hypothetical protein IPM69_01335 [Ignavibacteria bacterium]|nr:hypothetical protein [Ignavibacteria bacterium]
MKTHPYSRIIVISITLFFVELTPLLLHSQQFNKFDDRPKAKERIEQLKKMRLIDILDMDETTAEKFFIKYNNLQKKIEDAKSELQEAVSDLERTVRAKSSKSGEYYRKSDFVLEKQNLLNTSVSDKIKSMRTFLTEEQYAKFIVFENNFAAQLQKMLLERKQEHKMDLNK